MRENSSLKIMKQVYISNIKIQYNPTFLYCYETMHSLIISGFFVNKHPLQTHICEHYLWGKEDILASYPDNVNENTYKVNMKRVNEKIAEKLQGHSLSFLLNPNDETKQEEAEEFKDFIEQLFLLEKSKSEMACVNTFQKYLKASNLNTYDLKECINELNMLKMFSIKNIDAFIQKFADVDKIAYIGKILENKEGIYVKELTLIRKLMGDYISEKEMKELQKFTKDKQKEDTEMIKNKIKESIPSKKNIEKAKEIVEPEINCIEDTTRYKEGTKEQKRFLKDLCTLVTKEYVAKTKVYDTYNKDVKETLELFYMQIGKAMPVKEVQTYLLRDYHYRVFIEYLKETTGYNIERKG